MNVKFDRLTRNALPVALCLLLLASCARVYDAPGAAEMTSTHEVIAVIPPVVTITAQRKVSPEAIEQQQQLESQNFQRELADWLLQRHSQGKITVAVQDPDETRILLDRAGITDISKALPTELARALGVDAVLTSGFRLAKPISTGGAIALAVLFGGSGPTNEVAATMRLYDAKIGTQLWTYSHTVSGSLGSSPSSVTAQLMRNASKRLPYRPT